MKTRFTFLAAAAIILAAIFSGCSKSESADASDLLKTVPSDASFVMVANLQSILEDMGCKIDGSQIKPSKELQSLIDKQADKAETAKLNKFLNGDYGIDPSVCVAFTEGYDTFVCGIAADPAKFKKEFGASAGASFQDVDGVSTCHNAAIIGNIFWVNVGGREIDGRTVKHFSSLSDSQSFIANPCAEEMKVISEDIIAWGNIAGLMNVSGFGFEERTMTQVLSQVLFEEAQCCLCKVDFDKGEGEAELTILNGKGKPAKFLLPIKKVSMDAIAKIQGNADVVAALSVPHKMIEKLQNNFGKDGKTSFIGVMMQQVSAIDGTCAIAMGSDYKNSEGVITTTGKDLTSLSQLVQNMGLSTRIDGKYILFGNSLQGGATPVAELAEGLKGSLGGVVANVPADSQWASFKKCAMTLESEGSGIKLNIKVEGRDSKQNILLAFLMNLSK